MAVSYISTPFKSSPYELPLDLNLFSKVMSIKQGEFDKNAKAVQAGIDQMGLLDVAKDVDKTYLNSKINNLVSSINNFGGVDFSDQNVLNQIEGLGSDIYSDNKVLTAISSTKNIRKLQETYEKYKTDPKLSKLYASQNEEWDMQGVYSYLNDPTIGSKYSGTTTPTIYTPVRDNLAKYLEKTKADYTQEITDMGLFYVDKKGERITPERIMTIAAESMTPQERQQLSIDGWYTYKGATPDNLVEKGMQQFNLKKQDAEAVLKQYEIAADAAISDPQARRRYDFLIEQQKEVVDSFNNAENSVKQDILNKYKENPNQLYSELYSSDFLRGVGNRFSYNKVDTKILPNTAEMFRQKMLQADNQFSQTMSFKEKELNWRITDSEEDRSVELAKIGKYRYVDAQTGQVEFLDLPGYKDGHLITVDPNIEDPDDLKVTKQTLLDINSELKVDNDRESQNLISRIVALQPEIGLETPSSIGKGTTRKLKGQEVIEGFNKQKGFQVEDLQMFEQTVDVKGEPVFKNITEISKLKELYHLTPKHLEFLANQWKNYEAMALGKGEANVDLADGFEETAKKIQFNNLKINANNKKLSDVLKQVYEEQGLADNKEFQEMISKGSTTTNPYDIFGNENKSNDIFSNFQRWFVNLGTNDIVADALQKDINKKVNKKLEVLSTRDVYGMRTLSDKESYYPQLSKLVSIELANNKGEPYGDAPKIKTAGLNFESIKPITIGKTSDGTNRKFVISEITAGTGDKKQTIKYKTFINDENASKFGLYDDPYEAVNYSVDVNGRTDDLLIYGNKELSAVINIAAYNTNDLNDKSALAQIKVYYLNANGQKTDKYQTIKIPSTEGRTPSESYKLAEDAIKQAASLGLKYNDFIEYIRNYKTRK